MFIFIYTSRFDIVRDHKLYVDWMLFVSFLGFIY
jgi:hypothetical protein